MADTVAQSNFPDWQPELRKLVWSAHHGTISEAELTRLDLLLQSDSQICRQYVNYTRLLSDLQFDITFQIESPPVIESNVPARRRIFHASRLIGIAASLLLVGYFATIFGLLAWDRMHRAENRNNLLVQTADTAAAILTEANDSAWQEQGQRRVLQVRSGLAELHFSQGARVVVEGPAEFEVRSPQVGFLSHGRLVAVVPPQAVGFTIDTPTAKVVDLGTEFGVEVNPAGQTDVEVIAGKVDVLYDSANKPEGTRQTMQLSAGAARRFSNRTDGNGVSVMPIAPWVSQTTVGKKLSGENPELPTETRYAAAVLADKPLGYWRFSDTGNGVARDESGHGNHGEYLGFVSTKNAGMWPRTSDRSIRFLGEKYDGYVRIRDLELPASFSVELWAKSTTPAWNAKGWLLSCRAPHGFIMLPHAATRAWEMFLFKADTREGVIAGTFHAPEIADRFHQYAFSYDAVADRGLMFFDGVLVHENSAVFNDKPRREKSRLTFIIGRDDHTQFPTWGEGSIDELAIYNQVFSAEMVQRHYQAAKESAGESD